MPSEPRGVTLARLRGLWAEVPTPFSADLTPDFTGMRANAAHWAGALRLDGILLASPRHGEARAMTVEERARLAAAAVQAAGGRMQVALCCADQNMQAVLALARAGAAAGVDALVLDAPQLPGTRSQDATLLAYVAAIAAETRLPLILAAHPEAGYPVAPRLIARMADEVAAFSGAILSGPPALLAEAARLAPGRFALSVPDAARWLDSTLDHGLAWWAGAPAPVLFQTAGDRRLAAARDAAVAGRADEAWAIWESLAPATEALASATPAEKPQAAVKMWQDCLGQTGGNVRPPLLPLSPREADRLRAAFADAGIGG